MIESELARHFNGVRVFQSPHLPEFVEVPKKKHNYKKGMKISYHTRIQKKWNKRYGSTMERQIINTKKGIYCHPTTYRMVVDQLKIPVSCLI